MNARKALLAVWPDIEAFYISERGEVRIRDRVVEVGAPFCAAVYWTSRTTQTTHRGGNMTTETQNTYLGEVYTIRTAKTGRNFGAWACVLIDGRQVYETGTYPHDNPERATEEARRWISERWTR